MSENHKRREIRCILQRTAYRSGNDHRRRRCSGPDNELNVRSFETGCAAMADHLRCAGIHVLPEAVGNTNINEINVTHTAMSAGAMTAGGMAFTIPGVYMLNPEADLSMVALLLLYSAALFSV